MQRASLTTQRTRRINGNSIAWIFRTNLPPRRGMPLPEVQKRNFFGMGEILGVLTNPGETLRSLTDARKALEDARKEIRESKERAQLRTTHTFAPLPRFFARPAELKALERILEGPPTFTVLCGASSVGKTALLREVLSRDNYHVLHFDLRIAGFADLSSLYLSLSKQMEQYFEAMSRVMDGYEEFEKEAWGFKHDRLEVEKIILASGPDAVKTSDVARLMELFQSALLHYWEFEPKSSDASTSSDETKVERPSKKGHKKETPGEAERSAEKAPEDHEHSDKPPKRVPVIFFDEAHKLPALIRSTDAMKCLLDSMLVLTKQDRLCHVVHATSDSFYQTWLRQLNIMQHCKIISIGDCSKAETLAYFNERLHPTVPDGLKDKLDFESLYDAFGGKLVHWADYIADFVNANGNLPIKKSSHFLQAYSLINLQLVHTTEFDGATLEEEQQGNRTASPRGFKIYSPLSTDTVVGSSLSLNDMDASVAPAFSADQLLAVMRKLSEEGTHYIPYFPLCRELGVQAVDDMVRARVLELRWVDTITPEWSPEVTHTTEGGVRFADSVHVQDSALGSVLGSTNELQSTTTSAATAALPPSRRRSRGANAPHHSGDSESLGPKLLPTTPIVRYAMREVLKEYEIVGEDGEFRMSRTSKVLSDDRSDYASLSDVDEY